MEAITYTAARQNLAKTMDKVCDDRSPIIVTRKSSNSVVIIKDKQILRRINTLIKDTVLNPFEGIGKPAPLKHALSGYWSRRITDEHRFIYKTSENAIEIAQLRYHY